LPPLHGFRPGHSTETAVLRVLSDVFLAVTVAILLPSSFWTCQWPSARWTTTYGVLSRASRSPTP